MTYAEKIAELRSQVGDNRRRVHVDWTADGTVSIFKMPEGTYPVYEGAGNHTVKVGGTTKTINTDYTIDYETGIIIMVELPTANAAVTIDASAVYVTDTSWINIINSVIRSLGDDFWKEFTDETNFTTTAGMLSLALTTSQPQCLSVYDFQYRRSANENWTQIDSQANWRYEQESNTIFIGKSLFTESGLAMRIRGLKKYILGSATISEIDVQSKYDPIIEKGSIAKFWQYRYKNVVELVSKLSTESTRTPLQELMMLSDRFTREFELERARLKPQKPARIIPAYIDGGGRP